MSSLGKRTILIWTPCRVLFRISVWRLKRAILDFIPAVQRFAKPILKCTIFSSLVWMEKTQTFMYSLWQTHSKDLYSFYYHTYWWKNIDPLFCLFTVRDVILAEKTTYWWTNMDPLFCVFTVRDVTLAEKTPTQFALELYKGRHFFYSAAMNGRVFSWLLRLITQGGKELVTEQPTIDHCTWEGLRSIGGNKSCVKIIFWCGALSAYWFVIICTNSGEGGTMPSITVWK